MIEQTFVGRESEMAILKAHLWKTNQNQQCQVCLIEGNAGAGKTTLVEQFSQFVDEHYPEKIIIATGKCNAQTGPNDTYLPFREILNQLTGIQTRLLRNSISNRPSSWLRNFADAAILTLLELGPDLVGTFVPGTALLARVATTSISTSLKKRAESRTGNQEVKREEVREQYSAVLRNFAKDTTIILILDDLQWADDASLDLFIHLTKALNQSPILIIGTCRSEDKEKSIIEIEYDLKARFGEIIIDLEESSKQKGQEFTNLYLDAIKAEADQPFRTEFFKRTEGNALFSVELFRYLCEHELLTQNDTGYWVKSSEMDWNKLPSQIARLEGLIEARFEALKPELRQILDIASIEGQNFTAQVIMHFLELSEFELLRILSAELGKKHNLVSEIQEVPVGSTVLSNYRFVNATFHQYIYNDMSLGQRRLRHKEVAETLETLYGGHSSEIAFQLARHYELSYQPKKVIQYLNLAGEQLARVSEFDEAEAVFNRALSLSEIANDRKGKVDSIRNMCGFIWIPKDRDLEAEEKLLEALDLTRNINYITGEIYILRQLGILAKKKKHFTTTTRYYLESLELAKKVSTEAEKVIADITNTVNERIEAEKTLIEAKNSMAQAFNNLGVVALADKAYEDAEEYLTARLKIAIELNNQNGKLFAFLNLGDLFWRKGRIAWKAKQEDTARRNWALSKGYLEQALEISSSSGAKSQMASAQKNLADIAVFEGRYLEARDYLSSSLRIVINSRIISKIISNLASASLFLYKNDDVQYGFLFACFVSSHPRSSEFDKEIVDEIIEEIHSNDPSISIDPAFEKSGDEDREKLAQKALELLESFIFESV